MENKSINKNFRRDYRTKILCKENCKNCSVCKIVRNEEISEEVAYEIYCQECEIYYEDSETCLSCRQETEESYVPQEDKLIPIDQVLADIEIGGVVGSAAKDYYHTYYVSKREEQK